MTQAPAKPPRISRRDTIRADLAALKEATRRLENLRAQLASDVLASLANFETADLATELAQRLHSGEVEPGDPDFSAVMSAMSLTAAQLRYFAEEASLRAHDLWPGDYVGVEELAGPGHMGPLIRAAAAVAFDFDMQALRDLEHILRRMDVHSRFTECVAAAQPRLFFDPPAKPL